MLAIVFVSFVLRLNGLDRQSFWFDEADALRLASADLPTLVGRLTRAGENGPLFYLLLHGWAGLVGETEHALRFLSLAVGVLFVPVVFVVGKRLFNPRTAVLGAGLGMLSTFHIYYAQETKMYALLALSAALSSYLLLRGEDSRNRWLFVGFAFFAAFSAYLHVFGTLVILAQLGYLLTRISFRRFRSAGWIVGLGLLLAVYTPLGLWQLPVAIQEIAANPTTFAAPGIVDRTVALISALISASSPFAPGWTTAAVLALAAVGWIPLWQRPKSWNRALLYLGMLLFVSLVGFAFLVISSAISFEPRYLIGTLFVICLLLAAPVIRIVEEWPRVGVLALTGLLALQIAALANFGDFDRFQKDDFRGMAKFLQKHIGNDDIVLVHAGSSSTPLSYYLPGIPVCTLSIAENPLECTQQGQSWKLVRLPYIGDDPSTDLKGRYWGEGFYQLAPSQADQAFSRLAQQYPRIWLVRVWDLGIDPNGLVLKWLRQNLFQLRFEQFPGMSFPQVYLFSTRRPPDYTMPQIQERLDQTLGEAIELLGFDALQKRLVPGGDLNLSLYWRPKERILSDYKVFVHLLDKQGRQVASVDDRPLMGQYPTTQWRPGEVIRDDYELRIPADAAPGVYHVEAGMYEAGSERRLKVEGQRDYVPFGTLAISPRPPREIPQKLAGASWGPIKLLGFDASSEVRTGSVLSLGLFWQTGRPLQTDYTVFAHLADDQGQLAAQHDSEPRSGTYPTTVWEPGEIVPDVLNIAIPVDLRPGSYALRVGLYDRLTGQRLSMQNNATDFVVLTSVNITSASP